MLLLMNEEHSYRGVDRDPFEPVLDASATVASQSDRISDFHPPGWRRDLYRLAEESAVDEKGFLIRETEPALRLQKELAVHGLRYDVVWTRITNTELTQSKNAVTSAGFLGYDVAYFGGDFFSAIKNGLIVHPDADLARDFSRRLNSFGLFDTADLAWRYMKAFRQASLTEGSQPFSLYELHLVAPAPRTIGPN
jgi:hypothetical protein